MDAQAPTDRYAVRMSGVSKQFGGVRALDDVSFDVEKGEIHALLGENGAGKSTILKILNGVHSPSAGTIEVLGVPLTEHSPDASRRAGIGMIFQEMSLISTLTVAQNIFLNHELKSRAGFIDDKAAAVRSRALFADLGVDIDPSALVGDLSAGQRQLTEIVKSISQDVRVLILDEPTTALSGGEVSKLFTFLRRLKSEGVAIVYVSHRMEEITQIADRATILRDGRHVVTAPLSELPLERMIEYIVGRRSRGFSDVVRGDAALGKPLLELRNLCGPTKPENLNLVVHAGEVVGIAGLLGSGRSAIARVLFGIDPKRSGEILIDGKPVEINNTRDAIANGIALIPEDRLRQGVIIEHSVKTNSCLPVIDRLANGAFVSESAANAATDEQIKGLRIKTASRDHAVRTLSGGNQQKVVIGKWLLAEPRILILDEPTAGIDIGSKAEIIALVRDLAKSGKAIIVISSELSELLTAADRLIVMVNGRAARDCPRSEFDDPDPSDDEGARLQYAERQLSKTLQQAHAHV
jgi:ribose transport system ATP-binding protein